MMRRALSFLSSFVVSFFLLTLTNLAFGSSQNDMKQMRALLTANQSIGKKIGNHILIDQDGNKFSFKEYLGKPIVVNFIYTSCPHTCNVGTSIIADTIEEANRELGQKLNVITVDFDFERDTPQRIKEYGERFTKDFRYWRFATGDKNAIQRLTNELGFYYEKTKNGFDHLNMISIIDLNGEVYQHIYYGVDDKNDEVQRELIESLKGLLSNYKSGKDISKSTSISIIDRIKLICSDYDPTTDTYMFSYLYFFTKFILGNIAFYIAPLIILWRKELLSLITGCKDLILKCLK